MNDSNLTLTSLAILKVNFDEQGKDYVDYISPFVIQVLNTSRPTPVTDSNIRKIIKTDFGLDLPIQAIHRVLKRLTKKGYLKTTGGIYEISEKLPEINLQASKAEAGRHIIHVVDSLISYASNKFNTNWSKDETTSIIIKFLSSFSIECLRAYTHGTEIPNTPNESKEIFITCSFIREANESNPDLFQSIIFFVKGYMLSNALFCPDLNGIQRKFANIRFYLDTPLLLRLLRLQGEEDYAITSELVDLVKRLDGHFAIFAHTADELNGVLKGCEDHLNDTQANSPIIREMRRQNRTKSDLVLIRSKLDDFYNKFGITLRKTPSYERDFQIDESALQSGIEEEIQYLNPRAIEYDINSIRSIFALRRGQAPIHLEDANAVLVTSNSALARAAYEYGKDNERSREVSTVISDFSLANIAWLKAPMGAPDLPAREVLAICYGAMSPNKAIWSKYMQEIDKLKTMGKISADDHSVLRHSLQAKEELMNLTAGSEIALTEHTIGHILDRVKKDLVQEKEKELETAQAEHAQTTSERDQLLAEKEEIEKNIFWEANKQSKIISKTSLYLLTFIVFLGGLESPLITTSFVKESFLLTGLINGFGLIFIIWGIFHLAIGFTIKDFSEKVENYLKPKLLKRLQNKYLHK